jgi:GT2 family glycosyltransferase
MNIKIITVNFGDITPTKVLIDSISCCEEIKSVSISIADNCSTTTSLEKLNRLSDKSIFNIEIFPNKKNLYYWPAVKRIISSLNPRKEIFPDWILICNNDISIKDKLFFRKLKKLKKNKYPIIGPEIIDSNGLRLNPFMYKPLSMMGHLYWKMYFFSYSTSIFILKFRKLLKLFLPKSDLEKNNISQEVYSVHGAAILFSSQFFESGGWLDGNFDLYGEEISVAEIAKKLSIPIKYVPSLVINHNEHTNTKKINKRKLFEMARHSYVYLNLTYFKK